VAEKTLRRAAVSRNAPRSSYRPSIGWWIADGTWPVAGVLQVAVDVPQHGTLDVPLVVRAPAHIDLDYPHRGVVQVRVQPGGVDEDAGVGRRLIQG
jgi:hypothetical protein